MALGWILGPAGPAASAPAQERAAPGYASYPRISIDGDERLRTCSCITAGRGTALDPFVVEGWDIDACGGGGVTIMNTGAPLILRRVFVHSASQYGGGIALLDVGNVRVEDAAVAHGTVGIQIAGSRNVTIIGSSVFDTEASVGDGGIAIFRSEGVQVISNRIFGNGGLGPGQGSLGITESKNVTVVGNQMWDNDFDMAVYTSSAVTGHHNTFINPVAGLSDQSHRRVSGSGPLGAWDGGYPSGGNFYSYYDGVDRCRGPKQDDCTGPDGIGDTPYLGDRYPLMKPYGSPGTPLVMPPTPLVMAIAAYPPSGPAPLDVLFSVSVRGGFGPYQFRWGFSDGGSSFDASPHHTYHFSTTFRPTLTIIDLRGSNISASLDVTVGSTPSYLAVLREPLPLYAVLVLVAATAGITSIAFLRWARRQGRRPKT